MTLAPLAWLAALPVTLMLAIFSLELLLGQRRLRTSVPPAPADLRFVIVMPAHNEASGIGRIVQEVLANLSAQGSLLVVADNCTDNTAMIARALGARVIERHDDSQRGKGFALAFGRDYLMGDPPGVMLILDADCLAGRDTIDALIAAAHHWSRPVQAAYLLNPDRSAPVLTQISSFAFFVKNRIRQRALHRYAGGVVLTGTGMAFPWRIIASAALASPDIVEDLALGVTLTAAGHPPAFLDAAEVFSEAAPSDRDTLAQRRRWEHGFIATALQKALPLLWKGMIELNRPLIGVGLHLLVPPLTMLLLLAVVQLGLLLAFNGPLALTALNAALLIATASLLALTWWREGRGYLSPRAIARVPLYALAKFPSYAALLTGRKTGWVRTKRGNE